jgi:Cys-rich repeat protein
MALGVEFRRARRQLVSSVFAACSALALWTCGGSDGSAACRAYCTDLSQALADCGLDTSALGSPSECGKQLGAVDCSAQRPPAQLNCSELGELYACSEYCVALCERAAACGPFDADLCERGCVAHPALCNAQSVAPRSCEQIKPEARWYEDLGRDQASGGDSVVISSGGAPAQYGLCEDAVPCEGQLGCSATTNTCAPCSSDAECARAHSPRSYLCNADRLCVEVECLNDGDCAGRYCDPASNTCVRCRSDADCDSFLPACKDAQCVACTRDEHCAARYTTNQRCDTTADNCVECRSNSDCTSDLSPRCNSTLSFCTLCASDADCAGHAVPRCNSGRCGEPF